MPPAAHRPTGMHLSLSLRQGGGTRTFAIGRGAALALFGLLAAAMVWSLIAGFYVCFHDALLASLMSRQADMQYAYEDQIATLRTELDRETSQELVDRRLIDTTLHDLADRSGRLEQRAATIDTLVTNHMSGPRLDRHPPGEPVLSNTPPTNLRLDGATGEDHTSLDPNAIARRLAALEAAQVDEVVRLRDPLLHETHRLAAALAGTGLRRRVLNDKPHDVGGPFVPLDAGSLGSQSFDVQVALVRDALVQRDRLVAAVDRVPLHVPLEGPLEVSSTFGARLDPFLGRPALHTGIDLLQSGSDAVHATADGVVIAAGWTGGYGNMVEIDHGAGITTRYAHLSAIDVTVREHVQTGAVIGRVGSTGRATGPHLHYETRIDGEPVDPATFLAASAELGGK